MVNLEVLIHQHEGALGVGWAEEAADQGSPAKRELKLDVLLEISTERRTVQVVAEVKFSGRNQHVDLALNIRR